MKMLPTVLAWIAVGLAQAAESPKAAPKVIPPTLVHKVEPEYTSEARAQRIEGVMTLRAEITPDGTAVNIEVLRSLNPGLDAKAVRAVQQWRFRPAKKDGESVSMAATIDVEFRLPRYPVLPSSSPRPDVSPLYDDDPWDLFRAIYYGWLLIPPSPAR